MTAYKIGMTRKPSLTRASIRSAASNAAPERKRSATRTSRAGEAAPYHHGALHAALLEAADRVLERGLAGLTLRAVAREAGVSHAAPSHHFGDLTGLVSELAAIGYRQFSTAMTTAAAAAGPSLTEKATARAKAYVAFAQAHPGMYGLMFRAERLDMKRPSLHEAAGASFSGLVDAVGASRHEPISEQALSLDQAAAIVRSWSLLHGFTMLLLDDRLSDVLRRIPDGTDVETLLDAMLRSTVGRPPEP
jgi:AcrR family transcriptional regulator